MLPIVLVGVFLIFPRLSGKTTRPSLGPLKLLYAGSLINVQENRVEPAFREETGISYQGEAKGTVLGARLIRKGLRRPDVFISADPLVNYRELLPTDDSSKEVETSPSRWFLTFLANEMVIAYNPDSSIADLLKRGEKPWYKVLEQKGVRFGYTDPESDPKGYRLLFTLKLAELFYEDRKIQEQILDQNGEIYPENMLMTVLDTGQVDAVAAYKNEAVERGLPFIELPDKINLGTVGYNSLYASAQYSSSTGKVYFGSPILYTVTILENARHKEAAIRFLKFILSPEGRKLYKKNGFSTSPILVGGDIKAVPLNLRKYIEGRVSVQNEHLRIKIPTEESSQ